MQRILLLLIFVGFGAIQGCVPKTQYEDQQARLQEAQAKLKNMELNTADCDADMFIQLREQAQSLDLLTQELVERNTELSKEVARLKVFESQSRNEDVSCEKRATAKLNDCEARVTRTRSTYEDLVAELKAEVSKLKEANEKASNSSKTAPKAVKSPSPAKEKAAPKVEVKPGAETK